MDTAYNIEHPGDVTADPYPWTTFYQAIAHNLLNYRNDRAPLIAGLLEIHEQTGSLPYLAPDKWPDGSTGPLTDLDPFTTLAAFNRSQGYPRRNDIAARLATVLDVDLPAPTEFGGIPTVDARSSRFFASSPAASTDDIDRLWVVFVAADTLASDDTTATRLQFVRAYDSAMRVKGVKWNLTFGLFWSHPLQFLPLSTKARAYLYSRLHIEVDETVLDGQRYLQLRERMRQLFKEPNHPVHSFPDVAHAAWRAEPDTAEDTAQPTAPATNVEEPPPPSYTADDIIRDGCFLDVARIETILSLLRRKKNIILQGPPGTGKTWLARRLAFALLGNRDLKRIDVVQFHANSSYEDLVCGWRPGKGSGLVVADGPILNAIQRALDPPADRPFVLVIEEFNRGNPAHIFGELLTLLEPDRRNQDASIHLTYPDATGAARNLFIPENFYVIGTMNIADRSLAVLDYALRRRFSFVDLAPTLNDRWEAYVGRLGVAADVARSIRTRIEELNATIRQHPRLGPECAIGHSYVTPRAPVTDVGVWFRDIVTTEITPLLHEYWFDEPDTADKAARALLENWPSP